MRLLNVNSLEFDERDNEQQKYIIASHRWIEGSEITFQDVRKKRNKDKSGYKKIEEFARYVREHVPSVERLWMDTCCINKHNAKELGKSLNLMFEWYQNAVLCIAHLADVEVAEDKSAFKRSEWFKRGWTLQELLAPRLVLFVTRTWQVIGNKGASTYTPCETNLGPGLEKDIAAITGIPEQVLHDYEVSFKLSIEEKLTWMEGRMTTEPEDMSYALYGIFGVRLGANYGEGHERARKRLKKAIYSQDNPAVYRVEQFQKMVDWLSPANTWTNHRLARQLYEPQTGTWLLRSDQYRDWKAGSVHYLWMHGKAGCGKTILCSTAIEDIIELCKRQPNAGYAFFYFTFSEDQKQRPTDLLCSLIKQLGSKDPAFAMLKQAYDEPNRRIPDLSKLESILLSSFESYDEVFLLVDALDECPREGDVRHGILACLENLSQKAHNIKIFATSRELPEIRSSMLKIEAESIAIATGAVDVDIRQYVATELAAKYQLSRLDSITKAHIQETISTKSDGMFRWAYYQLQELKKLKSTRPSFVRNVLNSLPKTLDETYERMLISIGNDLRPDALTLLRWLAYATSPVSLGELVDATVIDLAEGKVDVGDRPSINDTLDILAGLVITTGAEGHDDESYKMQAADAIDRDTKVRLAHFSVKEYVESKHILQSSAKEFHLEQEREHRILAQSCLVYLMHYSSSDKKTSTEQDLAAFPLLRYAAQSWFYHSTLQYAAEDSLEARLICTKHILHDWLLVHQPDRPWLSPFDRLEDTGSDLYYASCIGLEAIVEKLLRDGADVHTQGGYYDNALQASSAGGHEKIVQMLLRAGAKVNTLGGERGSALRAASFGGHERVVQMLIDAGAEVNAHKATDGKDHGFALQAASFGSFNGSHGGHERIVRMLIDAGASVNAQGGKYGTALQAAASSTDNNGNIVQMLLHAGADINAQGGAYGNALQAASYKGNEKIVQVLLHAGAHVNALGKPRGSALRAASFGGHERVVEMLIDAGAEVNAHKATDGTDYGFALQAASFGFNGSYGGHGRIVWMLIDAGANVNAQGGKYGTALQAAAHSSDNNSKIVQMLLHAGADINAQGGAYGNALQAALHRGNKKVAQMLLDAGARTETDHNIDSG